MPILCVQERVVQSFQTGHLEQFFVTSKSTLDLRAYIEQHQMLYKIPIDIYIKNRS